LPDHQRSTANMAGEPHFQRFSTQRMREDWLGKPRHSAGSLHPWHSASDRLQHRLQADQRSLLCIGNVPLCGLGRAGALPGHSCHRPCIRHAHHIYFPRAKRTPPPVHPRSAHDQNLVCLDRDFRPFVNSHRVPKRLPGQTES